jgi:hypothetical protein
MAMGAISDPKNKKHEKQRRSAAFRGWLAA